MEQMLAYDSAMAKTIRETAAHHALSHAIIFSGSGDLTAAARYTAAAMLCRSEGEKPCMRCAACRKVAEGIHPDVIYVHDDAHKELSVESMRQLRSDVYIRPNEGGRKVYIFHRCEQLNERDQNVLLKIVEEGPSYAAFLFCVAGSSELLPTIRSRCVMWKMNAAEESGEDCPQALDLCRLLAQNTVPELAEFLVSLENQRWKREQVQELFRCAWRIAAQALLMQYGKPGRDGAEAACAARLSRQFSPALLQKLTDLLQQYAHECDYNVGVGHVLGAFLTRWESLTDTE